MTYNPETKTLTLTTLNTDNTTFTINLTPTKEVNMTTEWEMEIGDWLNDESAISIYKDHRGLHIDTMIYDGTTWYGYHTLTDQQAAELKGHLT